MKSLWRHANDREWMSVHGDLSPNHIWIPVESLLPKVVPKNNHGVATENLAFAAKEKPPYNRLHSKRIEEVAADIGGGDAYRLPPVDRKSVLAWCDRNDVAERGLALSADRFEFGRRENTVQSSVVLAVGQRCDLLGIRHRKRLEQERAHQAEKCPCS